MNVAPFTTHSWQMRGKSFVADPPVARQRRSLPFGQVRWHMAQT